MITINNKRKHRERPENTEKINNKNGSYYDKPLFVTPITSCHRQLFCSILIYFFYFDLIFDDHLKT